MAEIPAWRGSPREAAASLVICSLRRPKSYVKCGMKRGFRDMIIRQRLYQRDQSQNKKNNAARDRHSVRKLGELFDLARCQCEVQSDDDCRCDSQQGPEGRAAFLQDQRSQRLLTLGSQDRVTSAARNAREQRRERRRRLERTDLERWVLNIVPFCELNVR